jgi:RNA polymerase sigma-70 factor (ECF subfamily)
MLLFVVYEENKNHILEKLYEKYKYLMYGISYDILKDCALAEDAVHTAFMKLIRTPFQIDDVASKKTKAFIIIITRNTAIDIYNKRKREQVALVEDEMLAIPDGGDLPAEIVINKINMDSLVEFLGKMDQKYSDIVVLKYFYNLIDSEISKMLGITEQLVRVRLHRARKILVDKMAVGD